MTVMLVVTTTRWTGKDVGSKLNLDKVTSVRECQLTATNGQRATRRQARAKGKRMLWNFAQSERARLCVLRDTTSAASQPDRRTDAQTPTLAHTPTSQAVQQQQQQNATQQLAGSRFWQQESAAHRDQAVDGKCEPSPAPLLPRALASLEARRRVEINSKSTTTTAKPANSIQSHCKAQVPIQAQLIGLLLRSCLACLARALEERESLTNSKAGRLCLPSHRVRFRSPSFVRQHRLSRSSRHS